MEPTATATAAAAAKEGGLAIVVSATDCTSPAGKAAIR